MERGHEEQDGLHINKTHIISLMSKINRIITKSICFISNYCPINSNFDLSLKILYLDSVLIIKNIDNSFQKSKESRLLNLLTLLILENDFTCF